MGLRTLLKGWWTTNAAMTTGCAARSTPSSVLSSLQWMVARGVKAISLSEDYWLGPTNSGRGGWSPTPRGECCR